MCGIGRVQDAIDATRAGADAIGLVFHPPAKRHVSVDLAKEIVEALPAFVTAVGLFVDQTTADIQDAAEIVKLTTVQLHGEESPLQVGALTGLHVIKAIRADRKTLIPELKMWREAIGMYNLTHLKGFVLETPHTRTAGGTGQENDWDAIEEATRVGAFEGLPPVILAGGLTPENVGPLVKRFNPYAVDVSSGIEVSVGQKSIDKMQAFARAVIQA